jgi:hypothetical protein
MLAHAVALRAIGRVLDADEARTVEIEETPSAVAVSWAGRDGVTHKTAYPWADLDRLQRVAQIQRAGDPRRETKPKDVRTWTELLRTIGQDLDDEQAETSTVTGDLAWLTTSWTSGGRFGTRQYSVAELWETSLRRAGSRPPLS